MMPSIFVYTVLLYAFPCLIRASTLVLRQYQDESYSPCAKTCFEPLVNSSGCPFDKSGTRNACLCSSNTFLTNFMICTFKDCGGSTLAQTANIAVLNCGGTSTPSILTVDQLVNLGQGIGSSSSAAVPSSTVLSPNSSTSISSQAKSQSPSNSPTSASSSTSSTSTSTTSSASVLSSNTASGTISNPTSSTTSSNPPTSTPGSSGGGSSGLDTGAIVGIVFGIVSTIGVLAAIIIGIHQWNTRAPGARAVRDVGSWFCGCGRSHHHDEMPMRPYPRRSGYP